MRIERESVISANVVLKNQLDIAKAALRFYASQKHFDVVEGRTRLLDNGETAGSALEEIKSNETY